jgi:hypothetical protein
MSRSKVDVQVRPLMSRAPGRELDSASSILRTQAAKTPADYDPLTANGRDFARAVAFDSSDRCAKDAGRFSSLDR